MIYQGIDKFEYKYEYLYSSIDSSIGLLNRLGQDGWEVVQLEKPHSTGEQYKVWLKRRITEIEI